MNYRDDDAEEQNRAAAPDGVDRVVEVSLARNLGLDMSVCGPNAVISAYANDGGDVAEVPIFALMVPNVVVRFVLVFTVPTDAVRRAVADVQEAVVVGALTPLPVHRFPLDRTADAHDAVEHGAIGKVVIDLP